MGFDLWAMIPPELEEVVSDQIRQRVRNRAQDIQTYIPITNAEISGDDARVEGVHTRVGTILQPNSSLALTWSALQAAMRRLAADGDAAALVKTLRIAVLWQSLIRGDPRIRYDPTEATNELLTLAAEIDISRELPANWSIVAGGGAIFDARNYWRDWDKRGYEDFY
jgi:hypothetical protein